MTASLGRSGLTNCKMALHAHRETWDASAWITQIFDQVLSRPARDTTTIGNNDALPDDPTLNAHAGFNSLDILDTSSLFLDGFEGWPNHLFLGDLFDPSGSAAPFVPSTSTFEQDFRTQYS